MLDRARQAAQSARKIAVVEVLGGQAGWLALQAGIAVSRRRGADSRDPLRPAGGGGEVEGKVTPTRPYGLVVVAEGAKFVDRRAVADPKPSSLKASLSPLATR